jgi:hypothetical protein
MILDDASDDLTDHVARRRGSPIQGRRNVR